MKILIVGLGSIGKRHAACLKQHKEVQVAVLRTRKGTLKDKSEFREFYEIKDALEFQPDGVIIANPTSLHVETALPFLKRGIKTLIEKPIAHTVEDALKLDIYQENLRVAYCLRFLPLIDVLKKITKKENVFKLSFKRSYYLPKWHPYADYRHEYTAKKELGGGVIRTMSHEIDLMLYLFGEPVSVTGVTDKVSPLEIDTDDFACFTCKMKNGARVNFELDFFSPANVNIGEMFTDKGKYSWDMNELSFTAFDGSSPEKLNGVEFFDFNKMYSDQTGDFLQFVKSARSENTTFQDSINCLKVIESIDQP